MTYTTCIIHIRLFEIVSSLLGILLLIYLFEMFLCFFWIISIAMSIDPVLQCIVSPITAY